MNILPKKHNAVATTPKTFNRSRKNMKLKINKKIGAKLYSVIATEIDISSKALNKNTQFNTRNMPQMIVERTFFIVNVSFLCCPITNQIEASIIVAQIHLIKTSSKAGIPVCMVKNPIDPNIAIEIESFRMADCSRTKI